MAWSHSSSVVAFSSVRFEHVLRQQRRCRGFGGRRRLGHVTGVEWRLRVVFDTQLDRFGFGLAADLAGQPQPEVDTRRHTRRGHRVTLVNHPLVTDWGDAEGL